MRYCVQAAAQCAAESCKPLKQYLNVLTPNLKGHALPSSELLPSYPQPLCCVCILKASEILRKQEPSLSRHNKAQHHISGSN